MTTPFDNRCPGCGHKFSLADLKRKAEGDGWRRYIAVEWNEDAHMATRPGEIELARQRGFEWVSFRDFNPATMAEFSETSAESPSALAAPNCSDASAGTAQLQS